MVVLSASVTGHLRTSTRRAPVSSPTRDDRSPWPDHHRRGGPLPGNRNTTGPNLLRTREARGLMDVEKGLTTLLVMTVVAALAPFIAALLARFRLPQVVVFIVGGVLIGPEVLGWAQPDSITLLANVGLGFLFLLAGYELDLELFKEHVGRRAVVAWFVTAGPGGGGDRGGH